MQPTWRERVVRARIRGHFVAQDRAWAGQWSTCAVGELARRLRLELARLDSGGPADPKLGRLGTSFFAAVLANDVLRAETSLTQIEDHALTLAASRAIAPAEARAGAILNVSVTAAG